MLPAIIALIFLITLSKVSCDCGYPGFSKESEVSIEDGRRAGSALSSFREGETVYYICKHDSDIIVGNLNRTCINNEWTGVVPKCASAITALKLFHERNYRFITSNNTIVIETTNLLKIVGVRVKVNFRYNFDPTVVSVLELYNLPNHKCHVSSCPGNQGSEFNRTFTFTCFTRTTDMTDFERHDRILIGFSHAIECTDFVCHGRVKEVDIFQIDTDDCSEPDQPRYGTSVQVSDSSGGRSARMYFMDGEYNSTDRSRVGPPIRFPDGKMDGIVIQYACLPDFVPDNPRRRFLRRCPPEGAWSSELNAPLDDRQKPTCKPKFTCRNSLLKIPPDVIANFTDKWSTRESVAEGLVFFSCKEGGYKLEGTRSSECLRDGNWTEVELKCKESSEGEDYEYEYNTPKGNSSIPAKRMRKGMKSNKMWIIIGSVAALIGIVIGLLIYYYYLHRQKNFRSEVKQSKEIAMSQPRFPDGSAIPKRPGIPVPVVMSSAQHSNYLSHDSMVQAAYEMYSPTYEEINPLSAEQMYTNPMDDEHGYYSGSNSSKRVTEESKRGVSGLYVHMNDGTQLVQLRKH